ncbi:hypothetical protein BJY01DRAFT_228786 [Aspergillus pseudoustus]|uniref:2EXR domain-containing protein n=1 Tax=Aspergillus pseudoustus TaxID=1810923 RepID=A0ABR4IJE6_9EURO
MTLETFSIFYLLPYDIRREIYVLATPPRIVHIQEDAEGREEFKATLRTKLNLRLNPDLTYFAPNWRQVIEPGPNKQPTLESFGINTRKGPPQPWEPSASTPEIPLSWLEDNPKHAWYLMRDNSFYSTAPIPSLLHAFYESRSTLKSWGYQLAFRTRTNGPRTWFHFDRDVLFVDKSDWRRRLYDDVNDFLTPSSWSILGQFHSQDLKRVRRLALGKSGHTLFPWKRYGQSRTDLAHAVRLFPELCELQIVQWETDDLFRWRNFGVNGTKSGEHPWYSYSVKEAPCEPDGALCCVDAEEIDGLLKLLTHIDGFRDHLPATGFMGEILRFHKKQPDNKFDFFTFQQTQLEQRLGVLRTELEEARLKNEGLGLSSFTWKIPTVRAVHMIIPSMVPLLVNERHLAWKNLCKLKGNHQAIGGHTMRDDDLPLSMLVGDGLGDDDNDDSDEFHDVGLGPFSEMHLFGNADHVCCRRAKRWWAEDANGLLAEPGMGNFFPDWILTYPDRDVTTTTTT